VFDWSNLAKPVKDKGCPKNKLSNLILHNSYQPMITLVQIYRIELLYYLVGHALKGQP
jgi:hypothetical protein